ncbi:chitobiase/beta-hexosaminidase C-terminal domain-containing protein, partial [Arthrobacter sp. Soil782]|uniref:chitobiase/beta-hexosaminidase C-terminal domain-containing protein n=1 Tax=Arthrobacter sp. Soil782 TaxID=1736410 RepID=UPI000AE3C79C
MNPETGYPYWYGDDNGVRLELCIDVATVCPVVGEAYNPTLPLAMPSNFPEESFWYSAEASLPLFGGQEEARLIMATEAAFGGAGDVAQGQQNAFARMRIRFDGAQPLATYTATTPYGIFEVTADDRGRVRFTEDLGCLQQPCDWTEPLEGKIGPFLRWDADAPAGSIGDPNIPHTVTGSPSGTNLFRLEGPGMEAAETNLFAVQGKIATVRAGVDKPGGVYRAATTVNIQASFPDEAKIVYTTDGSTPAVDADGGVTNGETWMPSTTDNDVAPVLLATPGTTKLQYMAVSLAEPTQRTGVQVETYNLDATSPWIAASPDATKPSHPGPQQVTLTGTTAEGAGPARIYYTLDGSDPTVDDSGNPTAATVEFTDTPITVGSTTLIRAMSVDATDRAGEIRDFRYVIHNLKTVGPVLVSADGQHGYPAYLEDNGWAARDGRDAQEPVQLDLCLNDPLCPIIEELPAPLDPLQFPRNFPGESFWWAAEAFLPVDGEEVRLTLALEAAFTGEGAAVGDEVAFGRIRVRGDAVFESGATYEITHPYGKFQVVADDTGSLRYTEDLGSMNGNGDFSPLLEAKIGPFLRWTEGAPAGYLGDGSTPHAVVGSPYDTNFFEIHKVLTTDNVPVREPIGTRITDFVVQGKTVGATPPVAPTVAASVAGAVFNTPQTVTLTSTPGDLPIFFTTDGTPPEPDGNLYSGPITINADTVLQFIAVNQGVASPIVTETYTIDTVAPELTTTTPGGTFTAATTATLAASEGAAIRFTTDGTEPTVASTLYTAPIAIAQTTTLRAIAVDAAGNVSPLGQWVFTINAPTPPVVDPPAPPAAGIDGHDFSGDGNVDVLARSADGKLWLYARNAAGGW